MSKISSEFGFEALKYGAVGFAAGLGPLGIALYAASRATRNTSRDASTDKPKVENPGIAVRPPGFGESLDKKA